MAQRIPLALKQLTFEKMRFTTAISGVMVAVMLMWVQLGILAALYKSATTVHRSINADLVVLHPLADTMNQAKPFSVRTLYRVRGHADVTEVGEVMVAPVSWRNPQTGEEKQIQTYGIDPEANWLNLPGVTDKALELREEDTFLYDRRSKAVFGPVVPALEKGERFEVEVNHRKMRAVGLTAVAASFGQQGNIVTNRANFLRTHSGHPPEQVHLGLIRVREGADIQAIKTTLQQELGTEAKIMTPEELIEFELRYWRTHAPVGFIFTMGTIVGFFIGFIVVYQILYTDVSNHLPYYATMKAMGFTNGYLLRLVIRQGIVLAFLGYLPGALLAILLYQGVQAATGIPVTPTWERAWQLFVVTCLMCFLSGLMATRKLRAADPADVF